MKPKWKPHDDPQCTCSGCEPMVVAESSLEKLAQEIHALGATAPLTFTVSRERCYRLVTYEFDHAPEDDAETFPQVGHQAVWHAPSGMRPFTRIACACDRIGTIAHIRTCDGRRYVCRLDFPDGSAVDPSIDIDLLTDLGAPCPRNERGR